MGSQTRDAQFSAERLPPGEAEDQLSQCVLSDGRAGVGTSWAVVPYPAANECSRPSGVFPGLSTPREGGPVILSSVPPEGHIPHTCSPTAQRGPPTWRGASVRAQWLHHGAHEACAFLWRELPRSQAAFFLLSSRRPGWLTCF